MHGVILIEDLMNWRLFTTRDPKMTMVDGPWTMD